MITLGSRHVVTFSILIGISAGCPCVAGDEGAAAVKANDFLNSIGVCTHITQGEDDPAKVAAALTYTGIRAIRDDGTKRQKTLESFIQVHQASAARVDLLPVNGDIAASVDAYEKLAAAGALLAAEGPNEPNNFHVTYKGETSSKKTALPTARFQRDLYEAVKADPKLLGIPVFHSSEAGGSQPDNCGLQFLTIPAGAGTLMPDGTRYADFANTHNYVCGHNLKGLTEDNIAWNAEDPTLKGQWDGMVVEYGHTWWGKGFDGYSKEQLQSLPRVTTETGWSTRTGHGGNATAISEEQQGKLFLNLYLDAYKRGWSYTFIYMLRDSRAQGDWGFVHEDFTPKPSATDLHNLTTILADKPGDAAAGKLAYSIPNQPATVHDLLLQKNDGTLELAVWSEQAKGETNITVNLGGNHASVKVYDPTLGVEPVQRLTNVATVPLTMSDHTSIIEIDRAGR